VPNDDDDDDDDDDDEMEEYSLIISAKGKCLFCREKHVI
jgi:hypothetical protein